MSAEIRSAKPGAAAASAFRRAYQRHFHPKKEVSLERLLVWTYRDQRVIEITGRALYAGETAGRRERWISEREVSGDGCVAVERNAVLGCAISGGGPIRGIAQPLHQDAETVHEIVLSMSWEKQGQLVNYGRTGISPELPAEPRLLRVPEYTGKGWKTKVVSRHDLAMGCLATWCPIILSPDQRTELRERAMYAEWIIALEDLLRRLSDVELKDHEIIGIVTMAPEG